MKRMTALIVALVVLAAAGSALGSQAKHCGVVSYSWVRDGQRHAGKDAVFVLRGRTSCATARLVDSRADEGFRTPGWRCHFSQHATVTTCTSALQRAELQGIAYVPPPDNADNADNATDAGACTDARANPNADADADADWLLPAD